MEHRRVISYEVDRHLVPSCTLHPGRASWIRYFKIAELLRVQTLIRSSIPLRHAPILLCHPLLVLMLLILLLDGRLVDEGGRLSLTRRVLLLPLGTLLYPLSRYASWHVCLRLIHRIQHLSLCSARRGRTARIKFVTHRPLVSLFNCLNWRTPLLGFVYLVG